VPCIHEITETGNRRNFCGPGTYTFPSDGITKPASFEIAHSSGSGSQSAADSRKIDGVVSFPNVKSASIYGDPFYHRRNQEIWIRVAITVGIGGKVVWKKKIANLKKLSNRLAMIPSYAGSKILRCLDSAGGRFNGKAGDRDWSPGSTRVSVQDLVVDHNRLCGIGSQRRWGRSNYCDGLKDGGKLQELYVQFFLLTPR